MTREGSVGKVVATCRVHGDAPSKSAVSEINIIAGRGIVGEPYPDRKMRQVNGVTAGVLQLDLPQVFLLPGELLDELEAGGTSVKHGALGENIITHGIDLLDLGRDTLLRIGCDTVLSVIGLRRPCAQIDDITRRLLRASAPTPNGKIASWAGIVCVPLKGGIVRPGHIIRAEAPEGLHVPLEQI